jgi:N-dimethylarginine dimethylaminohydrolase
MKNNNRVKDDPYVPARRQEPRTAEPSLSQEFIKYSETVTLERFVKKGDVVYGQRITKRSDGVPLLMIRKK